MRRPNRWGLPFYKYLGGVNAVAADPDDEYSLNGGEHADNNVDIQEFLIMPVGALGFPGSRADGLGNLPSAEKVLGEKGMATSVGDEGFAPNLKSNEKRCS